MIQLLIILSWIFGVLAFSFTLLFGASFPRGLRKRWPILRRLDGKKLHLIIGAILCFALSSGGAIFVKDILKEGDANNKVILEKLDLLLAEKGISPQKLLKRKYPLGYTIFAADEKNVTIPNGLNFEKDFEIKWGNAKVYKLTSHEIHIDLPDLIYKPTGSILQNIGMMIPRKVGHIEPLPFLRWRHSIPIIEVLEDQGSFVVLLIGFQKRP